MRGPPAPKDWPEPPRPKGVARVFPFRETEQLRAAAADHDIDRIDEITARLKKRYPHLFKEQQA